MRGMSREKFSAHTSRGEEDCRQSSEVPGGLHVHTDGGREQKSAMHHVRGNAQWSND